MNKFTIAAVCMLAGQCTNASTISIAQKAEIQLGPQIGLFTNDSDSSLIISTREGGTFVCSQKMVTFSLPATNMFQLFDAGRQLLWSNSISTTRRLQSPIQLADSSFALVSDSTDNQGSLVLVSSNGLVSTVSFPSVVPQTYYSEIIQLPAGFAVSGFAGGSPVNHNVVEELNSDFSSRWAVEFDFGATTPPTGLRKASNGGYVLGSGSWVQSGSWPYIIYRVEADGSSVTAINTLGGGAEGEVTLSVINATSDGGYILGATWETPTTSPNSSHFGSTDYAVIKLDRNGATQWSRIFGGAGSENLTSVVQSGGGYLVAGTSTGSGVTGNKGIDGDGIWLLKLDSLGLKEAETIVSGGDLPKILATTGGYRLSGQFLSPSASVGFVADLATTREITVSVHSTGQPIALEVSTDLLNWSNKVTNFNGDFQLTEQIEPGAKFYRILNAQ